MKVPTKRLIAKSCDFRQGWVYLSRSASDDGYAVCNIGVRPPVETRREPWKVQGIVHCCCLAHARELERDFRLFLAAKAQPGFKGFRLTDQEADILLCICSEFNWQFKSRNGTDRTQAEFRLDWLAAIAQAGKDVFGPFLSSSGATKS